MKYSTMLLSVVLAFLIVIGGCSDDDCPTCPDENHIATAVGLIRLYNVNDFSIAGEIMGVNGSVPDVDSLIIDTSAASLSMGMMGGNTKMFSLYEGPSTHAAGDTINVAFYAANNVSTARVKLLSFPDDGISLTAGFQNYDSAETASFAWNNSPNADWYFVETHRRYLNADNDQVDARRIYVMDVDDTTLTILGDSLAFNGLLEVWLMVGCGPEPTSPQGNITGGVIGGSIMSAAITGYGMTIGSGGRGKSPESASCYVIDESQRPISELLKLLTE